MAKKTDNKFDRIEDVSQLDEALLDEFFSLIARIILRLTAQLERYILRERVKTGMERARAQGHRIGRSSN
jgi:DNA invertase Pin-like site-specific DNA recombinase